MVCFSPLNFPLITLGRVLKLEQRIKQDDVAVHKSVGQLSPEYCVAFCPSHLKDTTDLEKASIQPKPVIRGKRNNCSSYCLSFRFNVCALYAIEVY